MEKLHIQDGSMDKDYFTIIPNYVLNHSTHWDREVYIQMKKIAGDSGSCWMSQKTLAKQCGLSVNRLKESIKYLLEHKWIKKIGTKEVETKGGKQFINEYKITNLWKINGEFYKSKGVSSHDTPLYKGVSPNDQRGITESPKGVSQNEYKEDPIEEDPIKKRESDASIANTEIQEIIFLFKEINPSVGKLYGSPPQRMAVQNLIKAVGREKLEKYIQLLPKTNRMKYAPVITTPVQLENEIGKLDVFIEKELKMKINQVDKYANIKKTIIEV